MENAQRILSPALAPLSQFAAEYDCGAYGVDAYNSAKSCAEITGSSADGGLAFTGADVMLPLGLGIVLIVSSIVMIVRRKRRSSHPNAKD